MTIKIKKRRKNIRHRGSHTHGHGTKQKNRGKGNRGGIGMSGTGKRGDQKKTLVLNLYGKNYFGRDQVRRGNKKVILPIINIERLADDIDLFVKKGVAKQSGKGYEVNLEGYKVIGNSDINIVLHIKAKAASEGAIASVKKAGGNIEVDGK